MVTWYIDIKSSDIECRDMGHRSNMIMHALISGYQSMENTDSIFGGPVIGATNVRRCWTSKQCYKLLNSLWNIFKFSSLFFWTFYSSAPVPGNPDIEASSRMIHLPDASISGNKNVRILKHTLVMIIFPDTWLLETQNLDTCFEIRTLGIRVLGVQIHIRTLETGYYCSY